MVPPSKEASFLRKLLKLRFSGMGFPALELRRSKFIMSHFFLFGGFEHTP